MKNCVIAFLLLIGSISAPAEETQKLNFSEMYYKTEVGYVVITSKRCSTKINSNIEYQFSGYATSFESNKGLVKHHGCWTVDNFVANNEMIETVNFYYPEIDQTAVYKMKSFKRQKEGLIQNIGHQQLATQMAKIRNLTKFDIKELYVQK